MNQNRHRSHTGCWTCKSARRRCDRARPACEACHRRGLVCEGYAVRLRWGSGIASRGRFRGALLPLEDAVPARLPGRQRDLLRNAQQLFTDFSTTGIQLLHATPTASPLLPLLPQLCRHSEALYNVCVALQALLSAPDDTTRFLHCFDAALTRFRAELASTSNSRNADGLPDATFTAGLLLCTIGSMHGLPWTMHLQGMYSLLRIPPTPSSPDMPFSSHLVEVMGVMDLPGLVLARQTSCLHVWRRHCFGRTGVEPVSGLPRSLLDLYSSTFHYADRDSRSAETAEAALWAWTGEGGNPLQYRLWEVHRLAAILNIRQHSVSVPSVPSVSSDTLAMRALDNLDALRQSCADSQAGSSVMNATSFPLFVVGMEIARLSSPPELRDIIRQCFHAQPQQVDAGLHVLLALLERVWAGDPVDIEQFLRQKNMEIRLI
ncbi:hypothetical protein ASPZODRAFT_146955 [Penicilliopsis zonata CBS 506.65]|uniref:Zn(2)-C6 fungal-type domain-containing protein n=1 Tax=Penicilliopsis zonata CBS 506.65 TaxID=1073090 RepID=A0A1L9S6H9_9EURO|nr:hypothetical protein ASPZODRAFT_146955 [Penicilliopsis zonata CBS 506.65]OJJ42784.1 hypothetical protein ASPZODRAFT_146955 [Penicilliopsis zonata CBS 506.65]